MKYGINLLLLLFWTLAFCAPASAHNDTMAGSKWYFGKDNIVAVIELAPSLLAKVKGITEGHASIETCSEKELQEVVTKVIQPYLDQKLSISVNDKSYPVKVRKLNRKNDLLWEMWLSLEGVSFNLPENEVKIDYRLFFEETDDTHFNLAYIYSYDAAALTAPETMDDSAFLARSTFDTAAHVWEIPIEGSASRHISARSSFWANIAQFVLLGIKHILSGYDHMTFLLGLIVIGLSFKEVIKIITAFTVAHSITLLLAALEIVSLNSRFVEIMIAVSICYVALENLFKEKVNYRWLLTLGFGLIHGFGFATILQELIQDKGNLLPSVISFNVGVEIGQLMIFFVMIPVLYLLNRRFELKRITAVTSVAVFVIGFTWLIERVFDFKLLPS